MNGHAKGERDKTTNPLYARHFNESGHKFINPNENMQCNKIYLGESGRKFKIRMNEHAKGELVKTTLQDISMNQAINT